MFKKQDFTSHAGLSLNWKIECDDLTDEDIETLAWVVSRKFTFGSVKGIPRGGLRLAAALEQYCTTGPRLLVDDVLTTGSSLVAEYSKGDIGVVIFARGNCPKWVTPIFQFRM